MFCFSIGHYCPLLKRSLNVTRTFKTLERSSSKCPSWQTNPRAWKHAVADWLCSLRNTLERQSWNWKKNRNMVIICGTAQACFTSFCHGITLVYLLFYPQSPLFVITCLVRSGLANASSVSCLVQLVFCVNTFRLYICAVLCVLWKRTYYHTEVPPGWIVANLLFGLHFVTSDALHYFALYKFFFWDAFKLLDFRLYLCLLVVQAIFLYYQGKQLSRSSPVAATFLRVVWQATAIYRAYKKISQTCEEGLPSLLVV